MKKAGLFFYLALLSISIISLISDSGCANIIPPTGGLKDSLPPRLIDVSPKDRTLHFNTNRITFNFDEYLEVKDPRQNVIVSPVPKSDPTIEYKLRTITVKWKDTLQPNTTYSLNFGNAIHDINEGNVLRNFTYTFSTGSYIDSMQFGGKVILAATGKTDSTLIVMLHNKLDDSAVYKEKPRYVTTIDSSGRFTFRNLQPGTYAVYTLKDESGTRKYTSKSVLFGFADSPVVVQQHTPALTLYAFADTAGLKAVKKPSSSTGTNVIAPKKPKEKDKEKRLIVQINTASGLLDLLSQLEMQFATPLKFFDSTKIRFTDEKFNTIDSQQYHYEEDTTRKKITLKYKWVSDTKYHIIADKEFAEDTLGNKLLKTDTISFQTKKESDYGSVRLRFSNLDLSKNPVLQFVQGDVVKFSRPFTTNKIFYDKLFQPGEYELRILYDDNKNGVWDPGDFFEKHKQPEKVQTILINTPKHLLNVKSNWDNESDIVL